MNSDTQPRKTRKGARPHAAPLHPLRVDDRKRTIRSRGLDQKLTGVEEVPILHGLIDRGALRICLRNAGPFTRGRSLQKRPWKIDLTRDH
jgi:hypothetical protein